MTATLRLVAYLARDRETAETVARALEKEGIPAELAPAAGYHGLDGARVEVRVSGELASRARVLALAAVGGE